MTQSKLEELLQQTETTLATNDASPDIPVIKIVHALLMYGYESRASDIHIEPYEQQTTLRLRIDGILHDIGTIPTSIHELVVTRIKILSRLRTDEHHAAQDGKLKFSVSEEKGAETVDARVSIIPVVHGEKVVLRLLSEESSQINIRDIGLRTEDFDRVMKYVGRPWGMILATGPTGSGKTTTLYSILKELNTREVNISTIEDPVEYDLDGVNQIQVNAKTNLTFATGLRSIVRQDPDIIMVGEIRDEETAKIAINSAMTGHLVLSTIHTNDAPTTLPRLSDMGIQPFLIASTINIAIAQRLVRKICAQCKEEYTIDKAMLAFAKKELSPDLVKKTHLDSPKTVLYRGTGCEKCHHTGYKGRIGIFEVLEMTDAVKALVMASANAVTIREKAIAQGMRVMIEDGIEKVLAGATTIDELLRVSQE